MTLIPWEAVPVQECGEPMVNLTDYGIRCEPAYFNMGLSTDPSMLIRRSVAEKLVKVESKLDGVFIKVWDGFRSREVQAAIYQKFWNELKAEHVDWDDVRLAAEVGHFVAAPTISNRIPPHTTGGAVDLTLVDSEGRELHMGTGFDDFTPRAATQSTEISAKERENRMLLLNVMLEEEFANFPEEWWHFGFGDPLSAYLRKEPFAIYGEIKKGVYEV